MSPQPAAGVVQLQEMVLRIINVSVALAFIALTVVLFWAGIKYLTSGGDQKAIAAAHQAVTWALLGALFLVFAWLILLVIRAFTGVDVIGQFDLSFPQ